MIESPYQILFEPVKIGPVTAPNRFYAVPHATGHGWNQPSGAIALRAMKAEGGWGTVAVQITEIAADTDMASHPMERIWDDGDIPRHAAQVAAIKKYGSLAAIELGHGGMRARNMTTGLPVIGPSAFPVLRPEVPAQAREMTLADIKEFRESHKRAAQRAVKAGYDILYVYAAHDISLLSNFLSVNTNRRSDEYGGSFENRLRLLREVLLDTLDVAAGKQAVAIRFSVAEPGRKNGLTHDGEGRDVIEALAELPDLWDVNISGWSKDSATARFSEEGFQLPYTDFVKSVTSKPVVGVGRFTSPDTMVSLVKSGRLDLIGAARPSIADPFLPTKIRENRVEDIRECIGCNICVSMDSYGLPLRCTQNPTISEEWARGWHPESPALSKQRRSHLIVGAGPAGLECAATLLKAGDNVTIADACEEAGGRVTREARLPGLGSWLRVRDHRLQQLTRSADANLYLSSYMSATDMIEFGADTITLATGATWLGNGVGSSNFDVLDFADTQIYTPDDILDGISNGKKWIGSSKKPIVVYDDDHFYIASAIAEQLALDGRKVIYVTPQPSIATWTDFTLEQQAIINRLNSLDVTLRPNTRLLDNCRFTSELTADTVDFDFDELVFVGARVSKNDLVSELSSTLMNDASNAAEHASNNRPNPNDCNGRLFLTGDCLSPSTIQGAVLSGHTVARHILAGATKKPARKRDQTPVGF